MSRASSGASARDGLRPQAAGSKCGQAASAFAVVSPDEADREAAAIKALRRAGLPEDLIQHAEADPGAPFEEADKLAKMRTEAPADWARVKAVLKAAGVTISDLERAMGANDAGGGKQGRPVEWNDPEPWQDAVDGAALLSGIACFIARYVSIAPVLADAVALWIVMTWIHDRLEISPFLHDVGDEALRQDTARQRRDRGACSPSARDRRQSVFRLPLPPDRAVRTYVAAR